LEGVGGQERPCVHGTPEKRQQWTQHDRVEITLKKKSKPRYKGQNDEDFCGNFQLIQYNAQNFPENVT
jgi:hypothetical protein